MTKPHMARLADVSKFAQTLDSEFLICRDWSHSWDPGTVATVRRNGRLYRSVECSTCGTVRTRIQTASGRVVGNRMKYPEGYVAKGLGRISASGNAALRLEAMRRAGEV